MAGNSFGERFRITTCGESHGPVIGVIIDGCPAQLNLCTEDIQVELNRRKPGQSALTTPRSEADAVQILSGVYEGKTTGAPILLVTHNQDMRSVDYAHLTDVLRPSHADFTYQNKYGMRDPRGGGRASARETWARVAAGAVAKKYLSEQFQTEFVAYVEQVGDIKLDKPYTELDLTQVDCTPMRCPDLAMAQRMMQCVEAVKEAGDTVGGVIRAVIKALPANLGEPVFDKFHADLAKAMLSINAAKGFDIGSGFEGATWRGTAHNDLFVQEQQRIRPQTNHAGGVLAGITTGEDVYFRVAFKPVSTVQKMQKTVNSIGEEVTYVAQGRHDPCVLPRAVPIVEAMAALVVMDHVLKAGLA